ncbi:carboxypeptidase regulatory-like domain-containing protein [candidate division KSB1 bacterium]|nr:carboxypeptidase regulatory-like domain-containing protein [candidate division KSB1 bacterium]
MKHLAKSVVLFALFLATIIRAQWPRDLSLNLPICTKSIDQTEPKIISDGSGGAIILWADRRNGDIDLFAQRVSMDGHILWQNDGSPVYEGRGDQSDYMIVPNGRGGAYVTWKSNYHVYAQQLDANGSLLWNQPLLLCTATIAQGDYDIVADNAQGFFAVWNTSESWSNLLGQRVNKEGVLMWGGTGAIVSDPSIDKSISPKIAATGNGLAVAFQKGWVDFGIYVMILDANGKRLFNNDIQIDMQDFSGFPDPGIVTDGAGGAIICWEKDYQVFANHASSSGAKQWGENGIVVCEAGTEKHTPFIATDGNNGAFILWHDYIDIYYSYCDIYGQHLNSSGQKLWPADGVQVSNSYIHEWIGNLQADNAGGLIVSWETNNDMRRYWWNAAHDSTQNVWVQKIDDSGEATWSGGLQISTNPAKKYSISATSDDEGGIIAAWVDKRNGNADIYAQRIDYSSTVTGISGAIADAKTSDPIEGAMLVLSGPESDTTWSDVNGNYRFLTSPGSGYSIEASAMNYQTAKKEHISVVEGETTVVDFVLQLYLQPPKNLQASVSPAKVILMWQSPETTNQEELSFDDSGFENAMGWDNVKGIAANGPFKPSKYPASIDIARIAFNGERAGDPFKVYVYVDPSGVADRPSSTMLAGSLGPFSISSSGTFQDIDLKSLNLTLNSGTFFIGVQQLGVNPMWILFDEDGSGDNSFVDSNLDGIFSPLNELNPPVAAVFAIRAIVSGRSTSQSVAANGSEFKDMIGSIGMNDIAHGNTDEEFGLQTLKTKRGRTPTTISVAKTGVTSATSSSLTGYNLYRSQISPVGLTEANRIAQTSASVTSYEDANVAGGQTYYYVVTAKYDADESGPSNQVEVELPQGGPGPSLRIDPASKAIQLNESGTVSVVIDSVDELGSFEFTIEYNPAKVQIANNQNVNLGPFLGSTGRTISPVGPTIDNSIGKVIFGAFSIGSNPAPSIDRGGVLATIKWTAHDTGSAVLAFKAVKLTNPDGAEIANVKTIDGQINVSQCYWADVDCDGDVDIVDIQLVAGKWNSSCGDPGYDSRCDIDGDCDIDIVDIQRVAGQWGWPNNQNAAFLRKVGGIEESELSKNLTLTIEPKAENEKGTQTIQVLADDVTHLGAFQFDLAFDSNLLKVKDVQVGDIFKSTGNTIMRLGPQIDVAAGRLTVGAFSYGSEAGPCGSGVLAQVTFELKTVQTQPLRLEEVLLTDQQGNLMPVSKISNTLIDGNMLLAVPECYSLSQNYPNPFNPVTAIHFGIPDQNGRAVKVSLAIYNLNGQIIRTLVDEDRLAGNYTVDWDGTAENGQLVSSGIYFYAIVAGDYRAVKKMVFAQ